MKIFEEIRTDPIKFSQLVSGILFALSATAILIGWFIWKDKEIFQVPLIIMGICVVYLLVTSVKTGFALSISLLVVATIVTTENFILKISHLMKYGGQEGVESYLDTPSKTQRVSPEQNAKITAEKLVAALKSGNSHSTLDVETIEKVLKDSDIERLSLRFRDSRTLAELKIRPKNWVNVVNKWSGSELFKRDLSELKSEGLIICPKNEPKECTLTKLGDKVATSAEERGILFDLAAFSELEN